MAESDELALGTSTEDDKQTNEAEEETAEKLRQLELLRMSWVDLDRVNTFHDLKQGPGCTITETERRAISLVQMQLIETHIVRRLGEERWMVTRLKDAIWQKVAVTDPKEVTLYDVNDNVILPCTWNRRCSMVEILATSIQTPDYFVSHVCCSCLPAVCVLHLVSAWIASTRC